MDVLLIQKEGIDLYDTFVLSETSRKLLRFYRPDRLSYGVLIATSSLGGALSLLDELRWYIRRYVREVIIRVGEGICCTHSLALEIYERSVCFSSEWEFRAMYMFTDGKLTERLPLSILKKNEIESFSGKSNEILEVMMCYREYKALIDEPDRSDPDLLNVDDPLSFDPEA